MVVLEVVAGLVGTSLLVVAVAGAFVGMLVAVGALRVVRCERCHRFGLAGPSEQLHTCARCRHERLLHPLHQQHVLVHAELTGPPSRSAMS